MIKIAALCAGVGIIVVILYRRLKGSAPLIALTPKTYRCDLHGQLPAQIELRVGDTVKFERNSIRYYLDEHYVDARNTDSLSESLFAGTSYKKIEPTPVYEVMHTFRAKRPGKGVFEIRGVSNGDLIKTITITVR